MNVRLSVDQEVFLDCAPRSKKATERTACPLGGFLFLSRLYEALSEYSHERENCLFLSKFFVKTTRNDYFCTLKLFLTMTQAVFFQQFDQLPEAMKQELLAFFEYLAYKYKISQTKPAQTKIENDNEPQGKAPKAGFLKGTFVMADDFDEPLDDFKEYM